jgi:uncharacterized damage-inducible protein DinB
VSRDRTGASVRTDSAEARALLRYPDSQRAHVLGILQHLNEESLRRPILPSGWSCLGLVQHLALDVERFWFQAVVAGERDVIESLASAEDAWQVSENSTPQDIFDLYRQESERANGIAASTPLETPLAWWPADLFGESRLPDLRHVILHVMTETACHAGHLDAARELIDGKRWLVLTE